MNHMLDARDLKTLRLKFDREIEVECWCMFDVGVCQVDDLATLKVADRSAG